MPKQPIFRDLLLPLICVCGGFFLLATVGTEFNKLDVRFAYMLQDLAEHPIGIFPGINNVPYADYFSPLFFLGYLATGGGRFVNLTTLALPAIILSLVSLLLIGRAGEKLGRRTGFYAVLLLLSSFEYVYTACGFGIDLTVAATTAAALYGLISAPDSRRTLYGCAGLAVLSWAFRGSLGLVVFGSAVAGYLLCAGSWRRVVRYAVVELIAAFLAIGLTLLLIYKTGGRELLQVFFEWQVGKRVSGGDYFYYFFDGFFSFAPLTLIALAAVIWGFRKLPRQPLLPLLGFTLLPLVILSIPGGKHLRYVVPVLPGLALSGAYALNYPGVLPEKLLDWCRRHRKLLTVLPLLLLPTAGVLVWCAKHFELPGELPCLQLILAAVTALILGWAAFRNQSAPLAAAIAALTLLTGYCLLAIPFIGAAENSSNFVAAVEARRTGPVALFDVDPDHDGLKYLVHMDKGRRSEVSFLLRHYQDRQNHLDKMYPNQYAPKAVLKNFPRDGIVIVRADRLDRLETALKGTGRKLGRTLLSGNLGHRKYLAVQLEEVGRAAKPGSVRK